MSVIPGPWEALAIAGAAAAWTELGGLTQQLVITLAAIEDDEERGAELNRLGAASLSELETEGLIEKEDGAWIYTQAGERIDQLVRDRVVRP